MGSLAAGGGRAAPAGPASASAGKRAPHNPRHPAAAAAAAAPAACTIGSNYLAISSLLFQSTSGSFPFLPTLTVCNDMHNTSGRVFTGRAAC